MAGVSVVVQGGAMRNVYGLGVVRAMVERGLHAQVRSIHCVSSGVLPALALSRACSGRDVDALFETLLARVRDGKLIKWWKPGSVFDLDALTDVLDEVVFGPRSCPEYRRVPVEVALTEAETGEARYVNLAELNAEDWKTAVRGTMALPLIYSKPVYLDGVRYFDGGIADPMPLQRALAQPVDQVVAIASKGLHRNGEPSSIWSKTALRLAPHVAPAIKERVSSRNPLGIDGERLLLAGRAGSTELTSIVPSRKDVLVRRAEMRQRPLQALEQLGYHDAQTAFDRSRPVLHPALA
jgi:predicted patatin/cPLA2 family phospholipase